MEDIVIMVVTLPIFMFGYFVSVWTLRWAGLRADAIETGAVQGLPLSREARWLKLFHEWAPMMFAHCVFLFIVALAWIALGREANHPSVKSLAYAYAFLSGCGALGFLILGGQYFFRMISILRQAEAD